MKKQVLAQQIAESLDLGFAGRLEFSTHVIWSVCHNFTITIFDKANRQNLCASLKKQIYFPIEYLLKNYKE